MDNWHFECSFEYPEKSNFATDGDSLKVFYGDQVFFDGKIQKYQLKLSTEGQKVSADAKSKSFELEGDMMPDEVFWDTWEDIILSRLINEVMKGSSVFIDISKNFANNQIEPPNINPGTEKKSIISNAIRQHGLRVIPSSDGNYVRIVKEVKPTNIFPLRLGKNLISLEKNLNVEELCSKYSVFGLNSDYELHEYTAKDNSVHNKRHFSKVLNSQETKKTLKAKAISEMKRQKMYSKYYMAKVVGWGPKIEDKIIIPDEKEEYIVHTVRHDLNVKEGITTEITAYPTETINLSGFE